MSTSVVAAAAGWELLGAVEPVVLSQEERVAARALAEAQLADLGPWLDEAQVEARFADAVASLTAEDLVAAGHEVLAGLGGAERALDLAGDAVTDGAVARVLDAEVVQALESVAAARVRLDALGFTLAREACARGLHTATGLSLVDWLAQRCPWAGRAELAQLAVVARACTEDRQNAPIGDAVAGGRVPARRAEVITRALRKARASLDADRYEAYLTILLRAAADASINDAGLRRAADHFLAGVLDEQEKEKRERTAHRMRGVQTRPLGKGLTRFTIDAPAEHAAVIAGILDSKLARPQPGPDGTRDERTPTERRFDALMTVLGRGTTCPEGTPQMARATLFVVMGLAELLGDLAGVGHSLNDVTLSPGQVRKMACEAEIIPVVLGGDSQVLDLGRAVRLATPAQVKALYLRDQGCTFPGCSVPAQWTIAHHHPWFSRGGATDLDKLALLCEPHHKHVHDNDLTCTIDRSGVTWHV